MTVQLTNEALERYGELLASIDAPISRNWRPGLSDDEITSIETKLGFRLAPEIRTLWQWRTAPEPAGLFDSLFIADQTLLPPSRALAMREERREILYDEPGIAGHYLPLMNMGHHVVLLADSSSTGPSAVLDLTFEDGAPTTAAESLGELINFAAVQIQDGRLTVENGRLRRSLGTPEYPQA